MISSETGDKVDTSVEHDELMTILNSQLERLPELERQLLALYYGAEATETEIGKMLVIPQQTISRKLHEALEHLRANLTKAGVAAVVPLMCAENLSDAIMNGTQCPSGMTERLIERLKTLDGNAANSLSRRAVAHSKCRC